MPVSADPAASVPFTFQTIDGRTVPLVTRFLTRRQRMAYQRIVEQIGEQAIGSPELEALLDQAFAIGTNYTVDGLSETLTDRDIFELAIRYPAAAAIAEDERGKSLSRRLSYAGASAIDVPAAVASIPQPIADGSTLPAPPATA